MVKLEFDEIFLLKSKNTLSTPLWGTKYVFFIIYRCWIFYHRTIWDKKINNKKTCNNILNLKWYDWYLFESNVRRGGNGIRFFGRVHHSSISYKIRWDFYENQHEFSTWIFQFLQLTNYISMEKIYSWKSSYLYSE